MRQKNFLIIILTLLLLNSGLLLGFRAEAGGCPSEPSLSVSPTIIQPGQSATLSYDLGGYSAAAHECTWKNGGWIGSQRGIITVTPTGDTTYSINCGKEVCTKWSRPPANTGEEPECLEWETCSASDSATVKVLNVSLNSSAQTVYHKDGNIPYVDLLWTASSAFNSCVASSNPVGVWSGNKSTGSHSEPVPITQDTTFTLTCRRSNYPSAGQTYTKSASVSVSYKLIAELSADKYIVYDSDSNHTVTLFWTAGSPFDSCIGSSDTGIWSWSSTVKPFQGQQTVNLARTTRFTLTCQKDNYSYSTAIVVRYSDCHDRSGCISVTPSTRSGSGPVTVNWQINIPPDTYRVFYIENGSDVIHPIVGTTSGGIPYSSSNSSGSQLVTISKDTYFFLEMHKSPIQDCSSGSGGIEDDCDAIGFEWDGRSQNWWVRCKNGQQISANRSPAGSTAEGVTNNFGPTAAGYKDPAVGPQYPPGATKPLLVTNPSCDLIEAGWHSIEWAKATVETATACSCRATASPSSIPPGQSTTTIDVTDLNHTSKGKGNCKVEGYSLPHTFTQTESSHTYTVNCTGDSGYNDCSCDVTVSKGTTTPSVSCSASPNPAKVGETVTWTATSTNFTCTPNYTWSGDVSGTDNPITKSYSSAGTKTATIEASCRDQSATNSCSVNVESPPPSICRISDFDFAPKKVFLGRSTYASWNAPDCDFCTASVNKDTCYTENQWRGKVSTSANNWEVKPRATGKCEYTLTCGKSNDSSDTVSRMVEVEVYRAPIWREIAPSEVSGFLWSIIFGK